MHALTEAVIKQCDITSHLYNTNIHFFLAVTRPSRTEAIMRPKTNSATPDIQK